MAEEELDMERQEIEMEEKSLQLQQKSLQLLKRKMRFESKLRALRHAEEIKEEEHEVST